MATNMSDKDAFEIEISHGGQREVVHVLAYGVEDAIRVVEKNKLLKQFTSTAQITCITRLTSDLWQ